jgi:hypothetical protein
MTVEEVLLHRIKVVGDGEFTLLGTPDELITELEALNHRKDDR